MRVLSAGEREPVGRVLALVPARAEAEAHAPARDVVGDHHDLRHVGRVAERDGGDHRAEPQRARVRGERGERRPRVERAALAPALEVEPAVGAGTGRGSRAPRRPAPARATAGQVTPSWPSIIRQRSIGRASWHASARPVTPEGSTAARRRRSSKCRCGPVDAAGGAHGADAARRRATQVPRRTRDPRQVRVPAGHPEAVTEDARGCRSRSPSQPAEVDAAVRAPRATGRARRPPRSRGPAWNSVPRGPKPSPTGPPTGCRKRSAERGGARRRAAQGGRARHAVGAEPRPALEAAAARRACARPRPPSTGPEGNPWRGEQELQRRDVPAAAARPPAAALARAAGARGGRAHGACAGRRRRRSRARAAPAARRTGEPRRRARHAVHAAAVERASARRATWKRGDVGGRACERGRGGRRSERDGEHDRGKEVSGPTRQPRNRWPADARAGCDLARDGVVAVS